MVNTIKGCSLYEMPSLYVHDNVNTLSSKLYAWIDVVAQQYAELV